MSLQDRVPLAQVARDDGDVPEAHVVPEPLGGVGMDSVIPAYMKEAYADAPAVRKIPPKRSDLETFTVLIEVHEYLPVFQERVTYVKEVFAKYTATPRNILDCLVHQSGKPVKGVVLVHNGWWWPFDKWYHMPEEVELTKYKRFRVDVGSWKRMIQMGSEYDEEE